MNDIVDTIFGLTQQMNAVTLFNHFTKRIGEHIHFFDIHRKIVDYLFLKSSIILIREI